MAPALLTFPLNAPQFASRSFDGDKESDDGNDNEEENKGDVEDLR